MSRCLGSPHWSRGIAVTGLVFLLTCDGDGAACFRGTQEDPDFSCRFVLLVSGLGLGGGGGESLLGTQLLVDVVTGQLGDEGEQCSAAHVSRVILAGNLLSHSTQSRDSINKVGARLPAAAPLGSLRSSVLVGSALQRCCPS